MKKNLALALAVVVAAAAVTTVATALPTSIKKPSGLSSTVGVKLTGLTVQAACGKVSTVNVTLSYENLKAPVKAAIWGTVNQTVEVPSGSGSKTYSFSGPTLTCDAVSGSNWDAVMHQAAVLADSPMGLETVTYTASGSSWIAPN